MKVKIRVQATLDLETDESNFLPHLRTPERMAANLIERAEEDQYFFFNDTRTQYSSTVLEVDGVPQTSKHDWLPEVEEVAASIHAAWMDEKLAAGISSRKSESGEELMVAYELLSEQAKASNRNLVRTVYAAIADAKDD